MREWSALLWGIQRASKYNITHLVLRTDSKIIEYQLRYRDDDRYWKWEGFNYYPFIKKAEEFLDRYGRKWGIHYVPSEKNLVDGLSRGSE